MTTLLHIDASARPGRSDETRHGSHTRRLSARFVEAWRQARPADPVVYRDVGQTPPQPVGGDWIHAAFTPPQAREAWMTETLAESDGLGRYCVRGGHVPAVLLRGEEHHV